MGTNAPFLIIFPHILIFIFNFGHYFIISFRLTTAEILHLIRKLRLTKYLTHHECQIILYFHDIKPVTNMLELLDLICHVKQI